MGAAFNNLMEEETKESLAAMCCKLMDELAAKSPKRFEFLDNEFLELMNDIGRYGEEKYGAESFHARAQTGDRTRSLKRTQKEEIIRHVREHATTYENGVKHDHFGTLKHQLAAASFNLLMEYYFSQADGEK